MTGLGIIFALLFIGGCLDPDRQPKNTDAFCIVMILGAMIFGFVGAF
ncbi:MAG: hypothetical protein JW395_0556 [Nitrospira sp.]|nr:hypothetical protein [Nitrospira sp.]